MAEDKRLINSKTAYTLRELPLPCLEFYFNSPDVPKSMKDKLYEAIELKGQNLKGGLKGVSKSSGFIRRLMWENSHKHDGQYKNPTWQLAPDSTMKKAEKFEYKKLAASSQGGLNAEGNPYGASPFITKHFKGQAPLTNFDSSEKDFQKEARKRFKKDASTPGQAGSPIPEAEASAILQSHFGNVSNQTRREAERAEAVRELPISLTMPEPPAPAQAPTPAPKRVFKLAQSNDILSDVVLNNKTWCPYYVFWMKFIKKRPNMGFRFTSPFSFRTYSSGGFYDDFSGGMSIKVSEGGKREAYKDYMILWQGMKEDELVLEALKAYPNVKFYTPKTKNGEEKQEEAQKGVNERVKLMIDCVIFYMFGLLKKKGWTLSMGEAEYSDWNGKMWKVTKGQRLILKNPEGKAWEVTSCFVSPNDVEGLKVLNEATGQDHSDNLLGEVMDVLGDEETFNNEMFEVAVSADDVSLEETPFCRLEAESGDPNTAERIIKNYIKSVKDKKSGSGRVGLSAILGRGI